MGREVGRIVEVRGTKVRAELFELLPPYLIENGKAYIAPRINTIVKTKVGLDTIICQITGEYYDEVNKGLFTGYYLDLTVKGYFEGKRFVQGLRLLPMVAADIEILDADEFKKINACAAENSFKIGVDLFDDTQNCFLEYNAIIPSHIGIFGNTGSGKSNTLAKIMHEYSGVLEKHSNGKLLIIDINNEYAGNAICDINLKKVYHLSTRKDNADKIPIDYSDLTEDEWCVLLNATEATQRPVIKTAFRDVRNGEEYQELMIQMISTGQNQLIKSIQYYLRDNITGLENLHWHTKSQKFYFEIEKERIFIDEDRAKIFLDRIHVNIPEQKLKKFLFKLYFAVAVHIAYGTQFEFISPLLRRAEKLLSDFDKVFWDASQYNNATTEMEENNLFGEKNIAVVQLADINQDMMEVIPAILTSHLFKKQVERKESVGVKEIINIVIDEAHNLLFEDETNGRHTKITIETFEKAIKEGRKFGLFLWIASQRPSDISTTVISQMHNYFIHKLVNPFDLNRIRKAVAFLDENAMNALTVLGPGECIISGTGVNMPSFVKVEQLRQENRPNSGNIKLFGEDGIFENSIL